VQQADTNADFLRALGDQEGAQAVQPDGREEQSPSAKPLETSALSRSREAFCQPAVECSDPERIS
jgi:hypothetical protein